MLEPRQAEYLFDMKNDKWELVNLISRPDMKAKADELRSVLIQKLIAERDAHFIPEYTFKTEDKMPVQLAADDNYYPVKEVLNTALLVGKGKEVIPAQIKLLSDKNQFVRYWASIGLYSQKEGMKTALKALDKQLKSETYPPAKVNIAVTLFNNSDKKQYLDEVRSLLQQEDPELLRITVHLLLTVDDAKQELVAGDIEQLLAKHKKDKNKSYSQADELITLFLHEVKGKPIGKDEQFW
ncbi:hypothetical protein SDC9_138492 [bioreactor metagenome]|uniref:Beta-barrel assembly-enhancing protease n=1 Tax=bioreactor metagenome TaxID=1076179 RepID=A0A645DPG1_9ZZZZ